MPNISRVSVLLKLKTLVKRCQRYIVIQMSSFKLSLSPFLLPGRVSELPGGMYVCLCGASERGFIFRTVILRYHSQGRHENIALCWRHLVTPSLVVGTLSCQRLPRDRAQPRGVSAPLPLGFAPSKSALWAAPCPTKQRTKGFPSNVRKR